MLRKPVAYCFAFFFGLQSLASADELARLRTSGGFVEWLPQVDTAELSLRLAGPDGAVRSWHFSPGTLPSLALFDQTGQPLPDGLYTWELRASPALAPAPRRRLLAVGEAGDEAAAERLRRGVPGPLVQSGTFRIADGAVLTGGTGEVEPDSRRKDQTVPDDLIVDGKACIGLGCANGESFLNEALRLKQSVIRLRFEDTSAGAGLAARDWQLVVNDPGAGGAERFSIEDLTAATTPFTVRGNAPTSSLVIASASGYVGLGTAVPSRPLHIITTSAPENTVVQVENNGPARFRFKNTTTGEAWNFGHQSPSGTGLVFSDFGDAVSEMLLDVDGNLTITGTLGLGTGLTMGPRPGVPEDLQINALRNVIYNVDNDNNSTNASFSVSRDGNPNDVIFVAREDLRVGIATASPTQELTVKSRASNENVIEVQRSQSDNQVIMRLFETSGGAGLLSLFDAAGNEDSRVSGTGGHSFFSGTLGVNCNSSGGFDFGIKTGSDSSAACNSGTFSVLNAGSASFTTSSSRWIKENLEPVHVPGILDRIAEIQVYKYDFIAGPKDRLGLMAEDFHALFQRGSDKLIDGQEVDMALWLAVQELIAENRELKDQLAEVRAEQLEKQRELIQAFEERLATLERKP